MKKICALVLCLAFILGGCGAPQPEGQRRGTAGFSEALEQSARREADAVPLGADLDTFQTMLGSAMENYDAYSVGRLYLTKGKFTDSFEHTFPNQETLRGVVDKENRLIQLEVVIPVLAEDNEQAVTRNMIIVSCILTTIYSSLASGDEEVGAERTTRILGQLGVMDRTKEIMDRYMQGELFVCVYNGVRYTMQTDPISRYSTFIAVAADEGEEDTISFEQPLLLEEDGPPAE